MAGRWENIDLSARLYQNIEEIALRKASAAIENAFVNEAGGHTRFPGMSTFATLTGSSPTYLAQWEQDLIAVTNSRAYRIDEEGNADDVTGAPLTGDGRATFAASTDELLVAAGGPILRFNGTLTEPLSDDAPHSKFVAFIDGYTLAIVPDTGTFQHSEVDDARTWSALDTFAANGKPDGLTGLIVTPYREVILAGPDSLEQFERINSDTPFTRRWSMGEGIAAPYTMICEDRAVWAVTSQYEFARITGQVSTDNSGDIGKKLEGIDDWRGAWAAPMHLVGQKFILLQAPYATNEYGTKGLTWVLDYKKKKWFSLFGWDSGLSVPTRWPGWSYYSLWGRHFVGGNGKVLELLTTAYTNDGAQQRVLGRTGLLDKWGRVAVNNLRIRIKRGSAAQNATEPVIAMRVNRDNAGWTPWRTKGLGKAGDRQVEVYFGPQGTGNTFQWEWRVTNPVSFELTSMQAEVEKAEQA